jgi:hypothetical protein
MIFLSTSMLWLIDRLAKLLGLDLGIPQNIGFDSLDEREVTEQLHYGRD